MYPQSSLIKLRILAPSSTNRLCSVLGTRFFRLIGLAALLYSICWSVAKLSDLIPVPFFTEEFRNGLYAELHPATNAIPKAIWQIKSTKDTYGLKKLKTGEGASRNAVIAGVLGERPISHVTESVQQGVQSTREYTRADGAQYKPSAEALSRHLPQLTARKQEAHDTNQAATQPVGKKQQRRRKILKHDHRRSRIHRHRPSKDIGDVRQDQD